MNCVHGNRFLIEILYCGFPRTRCRGSGACARGGTKRRLGGFPTDLAFLFFSSHYAENAEELAAAIRQELSPRLLIGCTGEGIITGSEEIEATAAVARCETQGRTG
ncbi:MAG: hypothetical protein C4293_01535 [Nitrospiraceae bacterium]